MSRLPRDVAIALLRNSCLGQPVLQDAHNAALLKAAIRRTASAPLPPLQLPEEAWEEMEDCLLPPPGRSQST